MKNDRDSSRQTTASFDIWKLVEVLRGHLLLIVVCVALSVGAGLYYLQRTPPAYQSRVVLEVTRERRAMVDFENLTSLDPGSFDMLKTLEQTIASQAVLLRVIHSQKLDLDPTFAPLGPEGGFVEAELLERLGDKISVGLIRGTRLISIIVKDGSAERAQRLAQAVVDEFFAQDFDRQKKGSKSTRQFLEGEAKRVGADLESTEQKLQAYRESNNAVSLTERQNIVVERLLSLNQQVVAAKNTRLALEPDYAIALASRDRDPLGLQALQSIQALPSVADLRKQLNLQEAEIATLTQRYGPLHPKMIEARFRLKEQGTTLTRELSKGGELLIRSYEAAKTREEALEKALAQQEKAALDLDRISIPYRALERDVQSTATLYQQILDRLKQTDVTQGIVQASGAERSNVRVIEPASLPIRPSWPAPKKIIAVSILVGGILGCGITLALRLFDSSLASIEETEDFLSLPVLTAVPRSSRKKIKAGPAILGFPASAEAEAFRSLRASLSLLINSGELKTVLFTSAMPHEGKSHCSINYAAAVAQQGLRTLLIDGDLRRPRLRTALGSKSDVPGLAACLKDHRILESAIEKTAVPNLWLLADIHGTREAAELVGNDSFAALIRQALELYDRVVIDSAPVVAVSDALHIAPHVSAICLVVKSGHTPRRLIRRACQLLHEVARRSPNGVVLNHVRRSRANRYYYDDYARKLARVANPGRNEGQYRPLAESNARRTS